VVQNNGTSSSPFSYANPHAARCRGASGETGHWTTAAPIASTENEAEDGRGAAATGRAGYEAEERAARETTGPQQLEARQARDSGDTTAACAPRAQPL